MGVQRDRLEDADTRLRALYEISKLLVDFDDVERTVPELMTLLTQTIPLRNGICLLQTADGGTTAIVYHRSGEDLARLNAARLTARHRYGYLTGRVSAGRPARLARSPSGGDDAPGIFLTLPLVVSGAPVFGVLQVEAVHAPGEAELRFVNEVVGQLARAVAREQTRRLHRSQMKAAVRAERVTSHRLAFARAVTESVGDGIIVTDERARITLFNPAAEELLGWSEADAVGRSAPEVFRVSGSDRIPLELHECPVTQTMRTGDPVQNEAAHFVGRNGTAFSARYTATPLRDGRAICGAVLIFQDTTELKRAERQDRFHAALGAALAAHMDREALLQATVAAIVPAIADVCVIDEIRLNGSRGRAEASTPDDAGHKALGCLIADGAPQRRVAQTGEAILFEDVSRNAADAADRGEVNALGAAGIQNLVAVPLAARGRVLGVLTMAAVHRATRYSVDDITFAEEIGRRIATALDNVSLYEQAQSAVRAREALLGLVSHDLRAPLHVITLRADQLLRDRPADDLRARTKRDALAIQSAAHRMNRMVGDLLDIASIDAGHLSMRPRPELADSIVAEAVELMAPIAAETSVRIVSEPIAHDLGVTCDRERVLQVLVNLIGNAIKFAGAAKIVAVRVERWRKEACFAVADKGPGMPPAEAAHIFERFWQAPETAHLGTGLGLAVVKGIVEALAGHVWLESTVGVGTTFFFTLPLSTEEEGRSDTGPVVACDSN